MQNKFYSNKETNRRGWYSYSGLSLLGEVARGGTRAQIADRLGCSIRTVQRIVNSLRDAGYQIEWDESAQTYRIDDYDACISLLNHMNKQQAREWLEMGNKLLEQNNVTS